MGEVMYYEHEWERRLARLYLGPSALTIRQFFNVDTQAGPSQEAPTLPQALPSTQIESDGHGKGMDDLPLELLCKIFEHCVSDFTPISTRGLSTPVALSQVSSRWRSVAKSLTWLWNDIVIDCGDWTKMPQLIASAHGHLQLCGDLPISIRTVGAMEPGGEAPQDMQTIQNLVGPYAARVRHLTLTFPVDWLNNFLHHTASAADVQSLESVRLVYYPTKDCGHLLENNIFANAGALRKVEIEYMSELGWKYIGPNTVNLPWQQIEELSLIHVVATPSYLQALLLQCVNLDKFTLSIIKAADEFPTHVHFLAPPPPALTHVNLPSIRHLTLYNPKNFDYTKYLACAHIHFPSLEHFSTASSGDPRNGRQWSQTQFSALVSESLQPLRSVSTPAYIGDADIETVIGEVPSLIELDVFEGDSISETTIRLMSQGYLAPKLEVLKCTVAPKLLSNFLDMVESRYAPKKSKATYRGFKSVVIRCKKDTDGYREVAERIKDLQECRRNIIVLEPKAIKVPPDPVDPLAAPATARDEDFNLFPSP